MSLKTINSCIVEVPKIKTFDKKNVRGKEMFEEPYANIFICAYKKSGKTVVISNILKHVNKSTKIYFFVPTFEKDETYKAIVDYLDRKHISWECYEKTDPFLEQIINSIQAPVEKKKEKESIIIYNHPSGSQVKLKKKEKMVAAEHVFIIDDNADDAKKNEVGVLFRKNRHLKARNIVSSQHLYDLNPAARSQCDYILFFGGLDEERMKKVYENIDSHIPFELFFEVYKDATAEKFNFLYYDKINGKLRKNFSQEYQLPD